MKHTEHTPSYDDTAAIGAALESPRKIVVTMHSNPDGDALGSSLALYHALKLSGHQINIITPNDYPSFLGWMPAAREILVYKNKKAACKRLIAEAELIFCMDFNCLQRLEKMEEALAARTGKLVLIDHHLQPDIKVFDLMFSTTATSSTSELLYVLLEKIGLKNLINKDIAECLYVGIVTDTGSFSYSCNFERTYFITADLISLGVDGEKIHRLVYDTYSESRMRLLGFSLSEKMRVLPDYCTAYIYLSKKDLKQFNYQIGDTEGIVNYALSINGINMAVLFTEREGFVRMSFRSKGNFSVNEFVRNHYEGGGHRNAAGGNSYASLADTISRFEEILPGYREALLHASYQ